MIDKYYWMLVTLLFSNATAMEALPICLDAVLPSWAALLVSVTMVLAFGQIIPTAVCTSPYQTQIAVLFCPLVKFLMYFTSPITWTIAQILNRVMGEHEV